MRQRQDFYTLCPGCETSVELTLAAKLQAARAGCSCVCDSCKHEWVCIQEWVYRRESLDIAQPLPAPEQQYPAAAPPPQAGGYTAAPAVTTSPVPRPHLPTFQPPVPGSQPVNQQPAAQAGQAPVSPGGQTTQPVPAPHAWSWERVAKQQPAESQSQNIQPGSDH